MDNTYTCTYAYIAFYNITRCISLYPSIYLSIYLSIHPSIYLSIYLSIHPSIYLSIYPSTYLSLSVIENSHMDFVTFCVFTTHTLPMGYIWAARLDQAKAPWPSPARDEGSLAAAAAAWNHGFHGFTVSRGCFKRSLCFISLYGFTIPPEIIL